MGLLGIIDTPYTNSNKKRIVYKIKNWNEHMAAFAVELTNYSLVARQTC